MHIRSRSSTWYQALQVALTGLLGVTLVGFAIGCDSGGANGDDGDGDGDGDGSGIEAPAAPSGLEGTSNDGEIGLSWSAVDQADNYNVYRDTGSGVDASGDPLASGVGEASYTDDEAQNGTTYYYRVTAVASEGGETAESEGSGEASATPFAAPSGLEGTSGDSQIDLNWSAADGAASYNVYRSTSSTDGASGDPLESGVSEAAYSDETAENGTKYYYRVTSVNPEDEESPASNEVEKTPFSSPPDRPDN